MKSRLMSFIKRAAAVALFAPVLAMAAGAELHLDKAPVSKDPAVLQHGAKLFVNYCLNCHGASYVRYNRLQDIGLTEQAIRDNLLFTAEKTGELMKIAMQRDEAKVWFGAAPPDLSVIARSRASEFGSGADWLYTYLRQFYRDPARPTGWNNVVFENVGMPHALWELQGSRGATLEEVKETVDPASGKHTGFVKTVVNFDANGVRTEKTEPMAEGHHHASRTWTLGKLEGGTLPQARFDEQVADLVAYITYMSDPTAHQRTRLGVWVLLFLGLFTIFAWMLNRAFWKDVK